jgi:predicted nucleic acid-binding protein
MTKPIVYIETTIPSFYHDPRESQAVISRRVWTRRWWASAAAACDLITSEEVLLELSGGTGPLVPLRLAFLKGIPVLQVTPAVIETAETYIRHKLMPGRPSGDAFHLALASHHGCDFILTWNCRHLANANKFAHVRRINQRLGLRIPELVTPQQLLGGRDERSTG